MEIRSKTVIKNSIVYDFLTSMFRLNCSEKFEEIRKNKLFSRQSEPDTTIMDWVKASREKLTPTTNELLDKYFDWETSFGLCLTNEIASQDMTSVNDFIEYVANTPGKDLLNHFIYTGFGPEIESNGDFSLEEVMEDEKELLVFISRSMLFPARQKAVLYELASDPEKAKMDLLLLLEWYYQSIFMDIEEEILAINKESEKELTAHVKAIGEPYIRKLTAIYDLENFDDYSQLVLAVSRFYETFSGIFSRKAGDQVVIVVGNTLVKTASLELSPLENSAKLFSSLSDDTGLKILRLCSEKELTVNQLARILKLSNTEISLQISRLSRCRLIKTRVTDEGLLISCDKATVIDLLLGALDEVIN